MKYCKFEVILTKPFDETFDIFSQIYCKKFNLYMDENNIKCIDCIHKEVL